jgi:small subunit ribosomal protein S18
MSAPDRPGEPRGDREGGYRGDREGGYRGDREGGYRGDREGGYRGEQSVKSRLRAKARKKARKQRKKGFVRRKVCRFCADSTIQIDYKDPKALRLFITETGKMIPRRISGNCARHQRPLSTAIKRARHLALLPTSAQGL